MKRSLAVFITALLLSSPLWLARPIRATATTTQLTGTLTDAQGNPLNGYIVAQLPVPAQYTPSNIAVTTSAVRCSVVYGVLQTCPPLYDVAALQPQNLWYTINAYNTAGQFVMGGNYIVTGASFNLGAATPTSITTNNVSYLTPVSLAANNTFTGNNTFTQPLSVSATGVAPFNILSTTLVTNLNAQLWNGMQLTNSPTGAGQVPVSIGTNTAQWAANPAQQIVYSTPSSPTGGPFGPTTMLTPTNTATFRFSLYLDLVTIGSGCTGTTDAEPNLLFTDPNASGQTTSPTNFMVVVTNGTVGQNNAFNPAGQPSATFTFRAKAGTTIQYQITWPALSCGTNPVIQAYPILEQLTTN